MRIMFSPALSWTHSVAIRFIVVFIVLGAGSRPEVVSAAVFAGQISTPETPTSEEQATIGNKRVQEAEGDPAIPSKTFPKTLFEAITRKKDNTGTNEAIESTEPERLDPDRPHLLEASTTAGRDTIILEGGYTFNERKRSSFSAHDAPEAVFRAGVLAEWFEVRIGQKFLKQERSISGVVSKSAGIQDLYLGAKVALNEQKRYLPAIALIPQNDGAHGQP
jgi:hypothetical protein